MKAHSRYWTGEETHQIRISEIDQHGTISFDALLNLMQEVAWNNSEKLNFSVYDLQKKGLTWVVNRMQFHVKEYPRHHETVTVKSWPSGADRLFTYRDYQVINANGVELVTGTSSWLIIDLHKRKPVTTVGNFDLEFPGDIAQLPMDKSKIRQIERPTEFERVSAIKVGYSDIDVNEHTNNSKYVGWSLAHYYQQIDKNRKPALVDMVFKGESLLNDELTIYADIEDDQEVVLMIENETRKNHTFQMRLGF